MTKPMFRFFRRWIPSKNEISKPKKAIKQAVSMLRREYNGFPWDVKSAASNPFEQFSEWFDIAVKKIKHDPNAMILGTAGADGQPSTRTVLLKGYDEEGFIFYTNYESRKGKHLSENSK
ncbi:MAG: pyridoxamine 5'-phosphate oxidase family protein, partial [Balneolaceae bacterium]